MPQVPSHYDTLQVPQGASLETIRASYKRLARKYHPDRNSNSANSHCLMQALNAAFEVLGDPVRRADYDKWLGGLEQTSGSTVSVFAKRVRKWLCSRRERFTDLVDRIKPLREITAARWVARIGFVALVLWGLNLTGNRRFTPILRVQPRISTTGGRLWSQKRRSTVRAMRRTVLPGQRLRERSPAT